MIEKQTYNQSRKLLLSDSRKYMDRVQIALHKIVLDFTRLEFELREIGLRSICLEFYKIFKLATWKARSMTLCTPILNLIPEMIFRKLNTYSLDLPMRDGNPRYRSSLISDYASNVSFISSSSSTLIILTF